MVKHLGEYRYIYFSIMVGILCFYWEVQSLNFNWWEARGPQSRPTFIFHVSYCVTSDMPLNCGISVSPCRFQHAHQSDSISEWYYFKLETWEWQPQDFQPHIAKLRTHFWNFYFQRTLLISIGMPYLFLFLL